jgi:hypothetical protein
MIDNLNNITQTLSGYSVRNLKWNSIDNIIVGQVKCPILGRDNLLEGYVVCQWRLNGTATNRFKGREDLRLKLN